MAKHQLHCLSVESNRRQANQRNYSDTCDSFGVKALKLSTWQVGAT